MSARSINPQAGAALITVLMIIAAMSVASLMLTRSVWQSRERARALDAQAQLNLYAAAAENVARARLSETLSNLQFRLTRDVGLLDTPLAFPIEGGELVVRISDLSSCFDLNSLTKPGTPDQQIADTEAQAAFRALLEDVFQSNGLLDTPALVDALTDWLDSDSIPGNGGAEDSYYIALQPSYRTSGQALVSIEELRSVRGYTAEVVTQLRPHVCALPARMQGAVRPLNINTLRIQDAAILRQAFARALSLADAEEVIAARPIGGWIDVESLLSEPAIKELNPDRIQPDRLGVKTNLLQVEVDVSYREYEMTMRYLFEALPGQPVRTLQRERVG